MRYLLDTHAILWYVEANPDFPPELRELIDSSECLYSVASLWEIDCHQAKSGQIAREYRHFGSRSDLPQGRIPSPSSTSTAS